MMILDLKSNFVVLERGIIYSWIIFQCE